jgi:hypothetical protein
MDEHELQNVIDSVNILQNIPYKKRSVSYSNLLLHNQCVLHNNCLHTIVNDNIDVDVDQHLLVHYCDKCRLTFDIEFFYNYFAESLKNIKQEYWSISIHSYVCPLRDFYILNDKIVFKVLKKGNHSCLVSVYLHEIMNSRVVKNIIIL